MHLAAGSFSEDRSILAPLTQYQDYFSAPSLGAKGLIAIPTTDMWLQNVNGNAIVNGQTYPITGGVAKINLEGSAIVTLNPGTTTQIIGFVEGQQLVVGLDYDALKIMQDSGTITTTTQTTIQTFSTTSTPTVTIVETTSISTASSSTWQTQTSSTSSSTQTILSTSPLNSTQSVTVYTMSNLTTSSSTEPVVNTTASTTTNVPQSAASDFHLSASPDAINMAQSASGAFTVSVQSVGSFDQQVHLEAVGLPSGVEISFTPDPVSPSQGGTASSTATLIVTPSVSTGTYSFTILATSGSVSKQVSLSLRVSGCLIASATFGSELAPEVQFLRDFRDNKLLHTFAGSSFMIAFNTWYYSFSPVVAQYESTNPFMRASVKYLLYPLIWVLQSGAFLFDLLSFNQEGAVVLSGIVVSASVGTIYFSGPVLIVRRKLSAKKRRVMKRLEQLSFFMFACALLIVTLSEVLRAETVMAAASSVAVLATVTMSTLWSSRRIMVLLETKSKN